jgi:hypothetical protein
MITDSKVFPTGLYVVTIIAYVTLIIPTVYIWRKHGRQGFLGWNFVYGFCAIRIAGGALSIAAYNNPDLQVAGSIVNSMAISPLILAALGVLNEARKARYLLLNRRIETIAVVAYHIVVTTAMVLMILAIINITKGQGTSVSAMHIRLGFGLLIASWVVVCFWTILSLKAPNFPNVVTIRERAHRSVISISLPSFFRLTSYSCYLLPLSLFTSSVFV